ncbi:glycosyl transferase family 2 [Crinalium epipsammum PCC 9333]|uniref:Glycosyl transferase family 2 n=1 Tax=Crinalium epipsammum PCC 9333 TaxID=1173022 RepID=K9W2I7_9CYAN|nr:glycosyltransferase family 2 protein [Crinalium epipsammum]AFZ13625.1 glycosyl transferase family 2 [Crinalium epipsammum PCC 9333]
MEAQPLVSVIIIFLNGEEFIDEAIQSVLGQSYQKWELLLVDDGSTDRSIEIAKKYIEQYPNKIYYLEHEKHQNCGMSASRNLGIRHSKGKYVAFLDADDVWLPHKLEQQVKLMEAHPEVGLLCGPALWWYGWTGKAEDFQFDYVEKLIEPSDNPFIEPPRLVTKAPIPCPSTLLIRREALDRVGGFEETFRGLYEDQAFYAKVYLEVPVLVGSECLIKYRQHANSCCSVALDSGQKSVKNLFFLNWLENYLAGKGLQETEFWQDIQKQLWPYRQPVLYNLTRWTRHFVQEIKRRWKSIVQKALPAKL